jgi:uracil-DNA glycosylase
VAGKAQQAQLPWADLEPAAGADRLRAWTPETWPLADGWRPVVEAFLASDEGRRLAAFVRERLVHAVVLGQDPYHGPGQAEGLAFSVREGVKHPPSLRNIFKELGAQPRSGSLVEWARGGVLLLNTALTVEQGAPGSHARKGWEALTDALLERVSATATPCVYLLWGAHAQAKAGLIRETAARHGREILVLQANHPSPLAANRPPTPFLGSGCFVQARQWLAARGIAGVF